MGGGVRQDGSGERCGAGDIGPQLDRRFEGLVKM